MGSSSSDNSSSSDPVHPHPTPQTPPPPKSIKKTGAQTTEAAAQFGGAELVITGKWAFDIIYEFVYQFQEACQYRASAVRTMGLDA